MSLTHESLEPLAQQFWTGTGLPDSFPRPIERAVSRSLPLTIVKLPEVTVRDIEQYLMQRGLSGPLPGDNRDMMGCLFAYRGHGIIFVCGADDAAEQRFTIAHDAAHFIMDYLMPRETIVRELGDELLDVLDGHRPATVAECGMAMLRQVHLGPHVHILARRSSHDCGLPHTRFESQLVQIAEDGADALGLELVAPRQAVLAMMNQFARDYPENRPKDAGVYQVNAAQLRRAQATSLLNGAVEACDGTSVVHDTLPLTVTQIGVCMMSYRGAAGLFGQRLYRRDLRLRGSDPLQEAFDLLSRRATRASANQPSRRDALSELIRRGAMAYAERAFLGEMSNAPWRMGHGHPAPYELLTGSGSTDLLHMGLAVMRKLVDHKRFIFVPSDVSDRVLLSLGQALRPLEFMILERDDRRMRPIIEDGHLRGRHLEAATSFFHDVAPKIVVGMYRTYRQAPPRVFYAHEDYAQQAALIAMADSVLQPQRSFPTLIDLADSVAGSLFGSEAFGTTMQNAYSRGGNPLRFLGERETRVSTGARKNTSILGKMILMSRVAHRPGSVSQKPVQ